MLYLGARHIHYPSILEPIRLWIMGDWQLGNIGTDMELLVSDIDRIKNDPNAFWVHIGDYGDFIGLGGDKRFDPALIPPEVRVEDLGQLGWAVTNFTKKLMAPIADKCLGIGVGNHEYKFMQKTQQQQLHGWLCTELGVQSLGYCAMQDIVFVRKGRRPPHFGPAVRAARCHRFRLLTHHGAGAAATAGGKVNMLERLMQSFDADLFACGHVHKQLAVDNVVVGANAPCTEEVSKVKHGLITGTYLRDYPDGATGYGEQRGFRPTQLGSVYFEIFPHSRTVRKVV